MGNYNNKYLKKCKLNDIDLWNIDLYELQQSIEENAFVIVEFEVDATIVITKNEIYVKDWCQGDFPLIDCFQYWKDEEKYQIRDYIILEKNYDSNCMKKMMKRLFEKCKYTLAYNTKEGILEEINSNYL